MQHRRTVAVWPHEALPSLCTTPGRNTVGYPPTRQTWIFAWPCSNGRGDGSDRDSTYKQYEDMTGTTTRSTSKRGNRHTPLTRPSGHRRESLVAVAISSSSLSSLASSSSSSSSLLPPTTSRSRYPLKDRFTRRRASCSTSCHARHTHTKQTNKKAKEPGNENSSSYGYEESDFFFFFCIPFRFSFFFFFCLFRRTHFILFFSDVVSISRGGTQTQTRTKQKNDQKYIKQCYATYLVPGASSHIYQIAPHRFTRNSMWHHTI